MLRYCLFLLLLLVGCGSGIKTVNLAVPAASSTTAAVPTCVTFIGDSITEQWPMSNFIHYDDGCYINHGKGGTTVPQILDGIDNRTLPYDASVDPSVSRIVVVGGDAINSFNAGLSVEAVEQAYDSIVTKLRLMGVQPVLCTLLPTANADAIAKTLLLNAYLRGKATDSIPIVDVTVAPLVQNDGTSNPAYFSDRVHLNQPSYALLTSIVETAIHSAAIRLYLRREHQPSSCKHVFV